MLLFAGCSEEKPTDPSSGYRIKIGVIVPYSGECAAFGTPTVRAIQLAVKEINDAGGVLGKDIELIIEDSRTDPIHASLEAIDMADDVVAILGADNSDVSLAILDAIEDLDIFQISGASSATEQATIDNSDKFFYTISGSYREGDLMAIQAVALSEFHARIIFVDDEYGHNVCENFSSRLSVLGGNVAASVTYENGKSSYPAEIESLFAGILPLDTAFVVLIGYPLSGAQIIRDVRAYGHSTRANFMLSTNMKTSQLIDLAGQENVEGVTGISPMRTGDNYDTFREDYIDYWGEDPYNHRCMENWYDATILLAYAIVSANNTDFPDVRDSLRTVSAVPGSVVNVGEFEIGKPLLLSGETINYQGASGDVDFDTYGGVSSPYGFWKIEDGEFVPFEETR